MYAHRTVPWIAQILAFAESYYPPETRTAMDAWRNIFSLPTYISNFEPPTEEIVRTKAIATREGISAYLLSASHIAVLPADEKAKITTQVAEVLDRGEGLVWVDKEKGEFEQAFETSVVIMKRKHA